ncbi:MAG: zinc-binding dehydrogenase [Spirochaetales bacterium]|nr:zinc-binding dehydrogenase [Spirochaetales bacterium]
MKAAVTTKAGGPEVIQIKEVPRPEVKSGWILINVKAFGLNRSEIFTRRGESPGVEFPRIQGIECVGVVAKDPSGYYEKGQKVAAIMGGMGRFFDGGYAEYALVPSEIVFPFTSTLSWDILGAIPEMFQTVSGSLNQALEIEPGETLLIRGGTSSIGMLACQLAKATLKEFTPMGDIPSLGRLTVYMGESNSLSRDHLQEFIDKIEEGAIELNIDRVFCLDQVSEAHQYMEANRAKGKIVVIVG